MVDALLDALVDTGKLLPILFLTYLLMEYLEHHAGGDQPLPPAFPGAGPALGAALGLVPQCGFFRRRLQLVCGGDHYHGNALVRVPGYLR
ncbi:MAG: hypothetical protein ACLSHU_07770 [Oscillospiraceae bacterium]